MILKAIHNCAHAKPEDGKENEAPTNRNKQH